jgi:hypothetical protein
MRGIQEAALPFHAVLECAAMHVFAVLPVQVEWGKGIGVTK